MEDASTKIIVQQFKDWEIQILVLLSFALQLILFFFGGLRRRSSNAMLRLLLWLTYLSADFIAVYALSYLSRHLPTTIDDNSRCQAYLNKNLSSQSHHDLTLLWAPFLLVHLGGQDTVTAFSIDDNELWLRHLLNMTVETCLVIYVLLNLVAHNRLAVVLATLVFVTGVIKYGERIWALKCGSKKSIKNSTSDEDLKKQLLEFDNYEPEMAYSSIVYRALRSMPTLWAVFAGSKLYDVAFELRKEFIDYYGPDADAQVSFKKVEIELGIVYDDLYTKAKAIQTRHGIILRCVSLTFIVVAFLLFVLMSGKQRYYESTRSVDVAITYVLFIGAFCLEACAIITAMASPRAWVSMEALGGRCSNLLARATWSIFTMIQPETRPWWSNSMGQYNFVSSVLIDDKSRIAKMMGAIGGTELWRNFRHVEYAQVTAKMKELIHQEINSTWPALKPPHELCQALRRPFEEALLLMHVFTDLFLYKASKAGVVMASTENTEETQLLMDTCKAISDYMLFLLVAQPAMLPVGSNVQDLLEAAEMGVRGTPHASSKEQFLEALATRPHALAPSATTIPNAYRLEGKLFEAVTVEKMLQQQQGQGFPGALQLLVKVWVRLLLYAAGKSRPEEHTRRLSMGGELLTLVWLLLAHQEEGDVHNGLVLVEENERGESYVGPNVAINYRDRAFLFSWR